MIKLTIIFFLFSTVSYAGFFDKFEPTATIVFQTNPQQFQDNPGMSLEATAERNKDVKMAVDKCLNVLKKICSRVGLSTKGAKANLFDMDRVNETNFFAVKCQVECLK